MKLSDLDCDQFFCRLRKELGIDELISYSDACNRYNITRDHLNYQIKSGRLNTCKRHGRGYVLKCDLDRLVECKLLKYKQK